MTQAAIVERLLEAWRSGRLDDGDLSVGDLSLDDGLALQLQLLERLQARGEQLGGWKVGLTSGTALDRMGPGFRPFGFILAGRIFASGDRAPLAGGPDSVEGEVCFRLGESIAGADVTPDDVRRAVCAPGGAVAAGLELNDRGRYTGDVAALSIAANMTNWGIVVGDEISPVPPASTSTTCTSAWNRTAARSAARVRAATSTTTSSRSAVWCGSWPASTADSRPGST